MLEKRTAGVARRMKAVCPALIYPASRWLLRISGGTGWAEAVGTGLVLAVFGAFWFRMYRPEPVPGWKAFRTVLLYGTAGFAAVRLICLIPGAGGVPARDVPAVVLLCVLGPVCEEIVYRGLVFGAAERMDGFIPALILTTMLFAFGHGTVLQAALAVPVGLILGIVREKKGNLLAPAVLHISLNAAALVYAAQAG